MTTWDCDTDASEIGAVQKGREKGPKTRQRFGQTEVATEFAHSPDDVTRGVSGSPVAGELEGVSRCSHRAGLVAAVPSGQ